MKSIITFFFLFSLAIGGILEAGWQSHGPLAGNVEVLAIDPVSPSIVYAGTDGGVYRSADGGSNWELRNTGLEHRFINGFAIDPNTPSTLYAGSYYGVSKSLNSGQNWFSVNTGLVPGVQNKLIYAIVVDRSNSSIIYAATLGFGIYKSTNGGSNWNSVNNGIPNNAQVICLTQDQSGFLYAGTVSGLFTSGNGNNWSSPNPGLSGRLIDGLAADPHHSGVLLAATDMGVHKSTDFGVTWALKNIGHAAPSYTRAVTFDPGTPDVAYAGLMKFGVIRSTNNGESWSDKNSGLPDLDVLSLAVDPTNSTIVYAGLFGGGTAKTTNGGNAWNGMNSGIKAFLANELVTHPHIPTTVYAGMTGGFFRSTDNGLNWTSLNTGLDNGPVVLSVAVDPTPGSIVSNTVIYAGISIGIYRSTDGGANWTKPCSSPSDPQCFLQALALQVNPVSPNVIYAGTLNGEVWKSTNSATSWTKVSGGLPSSAEVRGLAIDPNDPDNVYAATYGNGFYKTMNGGGNWNAINNGISTNIANSIVIDPSNPNVLYGATWFGKVFKTTNGGVSWSQGSGTKISPPSNVFCLAIDPTNPNFIYAGVDAGPFGVFGSSDGGQNWGPINPTGLTQTEVFSLSVSPGTDYFLHAGTLGNSVFDFGCTPIVFDPASSSLPGGAVLTPYSQTISIKENGIPTDATYSIVSGALPSGFTLSSSGVISGFTVNGGLYNFTVSAVDGGGCGSTKAYSINVTGTPTLLLSDDFNDNLLTWPVTNGNWREAGGVLQGTGSGTISAPLPWSPSNASGCSNCTIDFYMQTTGGDTSKTFVQAWYTSASTKVDLIIKEGVNKWVLKQKSGGSIVAKKAAKLNILPGVLYHVQLSQFGGNFYLFINGVLQLTLPAGAGVPSGNVVIKLKNTSTFFSQIQAY